MPIILNSFSIRLIAFSLILIIITPPFNTWEKLIILSLSSTVIFFSEIINYSKKKKIMYISFFISVVFVINFSYKNYIIVNQIVLPTTFDSEFDYIKKYLPNDLEKVLKNELNELAKREDLLKNIQQPGSNKKSTLYKNYAFQSENLWTKLDEGKHVHIHKNLNFWDLGPSSLNDLNLNFGDPKKKNYKNNLIFPLLFKINFIKLNDKSELCFTGNIFFEKNGSFNFLKNKINECVVIDYKKDYFFLDYERNLKLDIKKNFLLDNNYYIYNIVKLLLVSIILFQIFKINKLFIFFSTSFFIVLFLYLKFSPNEISNFSETFYFDRGMDGMAHYGYSRIILNNFFLGNFYESLKGVEEIFYYMPLSRYLNSILSIFFGDNILGNIFIISFFPILIFNILSLLLSIKYAKYLTSLFIFTPIFESLGFTLINYINFTVDGYGEGICYLFLILMVYLFLKNNDKSYFFLIGFLSFLVIGLRPNYIALILPLFLCYFVYLFKKKESFDQFYKNLLFLITGGSFILLITFHNYIYSNEFVLLIKSENIQNSLQIRFDDYLSFFSSLTNFNLENINIIKILNHLNHYIKIYEVWFMIVLLNLFIAILVSLDIKIKILSFSLIIMHSSYFFFLGDPRYSMGTWLLSFLIFLIIFDKIYLPYFKRRIFSAKQ